MSLSKENYDKLNEHFLYEKEPIIDNNFYIGNTPTIYHCKNWTFKVHKYDDGKAYMNDTYFDNSEIEVTDENIDQFTVIFDFRKVKRISDSEIDEYNEEDLYRAAINSGGYSCGGLYWVKKNAVKSKCLLINKKKEKIESLKWQLKCTKKDLEKLLEG